MRTLVGKMPSTSNRSERRRAAILAAAGEVFDQQGFAGASVDEIASRAAASKQTLYRNFPDKAALFEALLRERIDTATDQVHRVMSGLRPTGDVTADLQQVGRTLVREATRPEVLRLRRLVTAESRRFPELGRAFYLAGPGRTISGLAQTLTRLVEAGGLVVPDVEVAAEHFNWLVVSVPLNRAMLLGEDQIMTAEEQQRWADEGVSAFLRAYGADPAKGS